jgi:hypothetical protein
VSAFLDVEAGCRSNPRGERIGVASGVPHDSNRGGIMPGGKQGTRAGQKWLPRTGDDKPTIAPNFESASALGEPP